MQSAAALVSVWLYATRNLAAGSRVDIGAAGILVGAARLRHAGLGCAGTPGRYLGWNAAAGARIHRRGALVEQRALARELDRNRDCRGAKWRNDFGLSHRRRFADGAGGRADDAQPSRVAARAGDTPLQNRTAGTRRRDYGIGLHSLSLAGWARRQMGHGAARTNGARVSRAAAGRGPGDFSGARTADRFATAPSARARPGPGLRESARVSRRRRFARHLLDGYGAARATDHAALSDGAQSGGMDRARRRTAAARQDLAQYRRG